MKDLSFCQLLGLQIRKQKFQTLKNFLQKRFQQPYDDKDFYFFEIKNIQCEIFLKIPSIPQYFVLSEAIFDARFAEYINSFVEKNVIAKTAA